LTTDFIMILTVTQGNKNKLFWTLHLFCTSYFNSGALEVILDSDTEMAVTNAWSFCYSLHYHCMITDTRVQSGDKVVIRIGTVVFDSQQGHSFLHSSQNLRFLADSSSLSAASGANVNDTWHHTSTTSFFMWII
jgi:hypothetical protein